MPGGDTARPEAEDDREERIEDLKRFVEELCDGQMELGGPNDCPAEIEEAFWKHVVDYEEAPTAGVTSPAGFGR